MSALDAFWAAPPVSRTIAAAALLLSVSVYMGFLPGHLVIFDLYSVCAVPPQIWRLFTPFLITGKDLSIIFDTYFLYQYGSKLESTSPRFPRPGDFFTYFLFVCSVIIILNILVTGGIIFTSALVLAFTYTSAQDDRGQKANFFIVTIPAEWIPFAMLLMNFIMAGPYSAKVQITGLVAAHLHDFLTRLWPTFGGGSNLVPTPRLITHFWKPSDPVVNTRLHGNAYTSSQRATATSSSLSGRVLPQSWKSRGSGHRLGGG
ncbi:hypothetical protein K3495_g11475 [Podosphaera aphanis]|nr:hypothetical protein K3495_g11475 [Podosphaera aphanis]